MQKDSNHHWVCKLLWATFFFSLWRFSYSLTICNKQTSKKNCHNYLQPTYYYCFLCIYCSVFPIYMYIFDHNLYFWRLPDDCFARGVKLWVASYKCSDLCEFRANIPAFYSRLQLAAPCFADIQQKSFSCKKVKKKHLGNWWREL